MEGGRRLEGAQPSQRVRRAAGIGRRTTATALATVLVVLAAACGSDDPGSDRDQIRVVVADVQEAFDAGDLKGVCELLTRAAQRHIETIAHRAGDPCARSLKVVQTGVRDLRGQPKATAHEILEIRVRGSVATATLDLGEGSRGEVPLSKQDGEWKVNGLYGGLPAQDQTDKF